MHTISAAWGLLAYAMATVWGWRIDMGSFEVQTPQPEEQSLVVTTEQDVVDQFDGLTSLREAIGYANSLTGADTVTFDVGVFGTAQTINLVHSELDITDAVTINAHGGRRCSRLMPVMGQMACSIRVMVRESLMLMTATTPVI